jgi:hypothetical protein
MIKRFAKELHQKYGFSYQADENGLYWMDLYKGKVWLYFGNWKYLGVMKLGLYIVENEEYMDGYVVYKLIRVFSKYSEKKLSLKPCIGIDKDKYCVYGLESFADIPSDSTTEWLILAIGKLEKKVNKKLALAHLV